MKLDKSLKKKIISIKNKELKSIKDHFDLGLIRNASFSVGTDFYSAQMALNSHQSIPLIIPLQRRELQGNKELANYDPFKMVRSLVKLKLSVFLVASDRQFWGGDPSHIKLAKTGSEVSVIQRDFFIDEVQLYQAKSFGADGVLLDADFLDSVKLASFADITFQLGLEPFLKIYSVSDLAHVEPEIIGGLVVEKDNADEILTSDFYQKVKAKKHSQVPFILSSSWFSRQEMAGFGERGIHHFVLDDTWLNRQNAIFELERMIQHNWPDKG